MFKFDPNDLDYALHVFEDELPIRGNAMASGDDAHDKQVEDQIIADLSSGNIWAWANVTVIATHPDLPHLVGRDTLGACSYASEDDFKRGGYYDDMKHEAAEDLRRQIEELQSVLCE